MFDPESTALDILIPKYLVHCYIYYKLGTSIISDSQFDTMAQRIYRNWDDIDHPNKDLIDKEGLKSGGSYIQFTSRIEHAANYLLRNQDTTMKFDILKLRKAIDKYSMNIGEENIHIHVPDNRAKERTHLGLSEVCHKCPRSAWFAFRKIHQKEHPPQLMRLFQRGHREEFFFTELLNRIGLTVWEINPKTGKHFKVSDCEGHLRGTMDRVGKDKLMHFASTTDAFLIEFKTSNDARFKKLKKEGLKKSNPQYYGQIQGYMGLEKNLKGCLFMSVNKNDDEIYIEWVTPDPEALQHILVRAEDILNATAPIRRIAKRKGYWECKTMCSYMDHCFDKDRQSDRSCRSCRNARPIAGGKWKCVLSKQKYGKLCKQWEDCNVK